MKKAFNLKKYVKTAFYEGVQGYWAVNSRCWPNCLKSKTDGTGKSWEVARCECTEEYNIWETDKWAYKYTSCLNDSKNKIVPFELPGQEKAKKAAKK